MKALKFASVYTQFKKSVKGLLKTLEEKDPATPCLAECTFDAKCDAIMDAAVDCGVDNMRKHLEKHSLEAYYACISEGSSSSIADCGSVSAIVGCKLPENEANCAKESKQV